MGLNPFIFLASTAFCGNKSDSLIMCWVKKYFFVYSKLAAVLKFSGHHIEAGPYCSQEGMSQC